MKEKRKIRVREFVRNWTVSLLIAFPIVGLYIAHDVTGHRYFFWGYAVLLLSLIGYMFWVAAHFYGEGYWTRKRVAAALEPIDFKDREINAVSPKGTAVRIPLGDLQKISLEIYSPGTWDEECIWILNYGKRQTAIFKHYTAGMEKILPALKNLPGFSDENLRRALESEENQLFTLWKQS